MALLDNQIDAVIMTAFPQYKQEEIESWTMEKTAKIFAMAEWSLKELRGFPIEIVVDPPTGNNDQGNAPPLPVPKNPFNH